MNVIDRLTSSTLPMRGESATAFVIRSNKSVISDWDRKTTKLLYKSNYGTKHPLENVTAYSHADRFRTRDPRMHPPTFDPVPLVVAL
jgi:hypothetical protein